MLAGSGRWLRSPPLHFVLIGAALFGVRALYVSSVSPARAVERRTIEISTERIRNLEQDFRRRWDASPTPEQLAASIEQEIESELLYREARVLGLDVDDPSVGRRLVEKMRALAHRPGSSPTELIREARTLGLDDDLVIRGLLITKMRLFLETDPDAAPLTDEALEEYLARNSERFAQPAALSFSQVFMSPPTRGERLDADARAMLARLRSQRPVPEAIGALSDPFPLGSEYRAQPRARIAARFGASFAEQVFALPLGVWSGPIASPFGLHLVVVHERSAARQPSLDAVRQQVSEAVRAELAAARLERGLARLRGLYEIRVEGRADLSSSARGPFS